MAVSLHDAPPRRQPSGSANATYAGGAERHTTLGCPAMEMGMARHTMADGWTRSTYTEWCRAIDEGPFAPKAMRRAAAAHPTR